MIRLLVADYSDVIRFGLHSLIHNEPDIEIIGMAPDGEVAVQIAVADVPDVVLMDLSMPILEGSQPPGRSDVSRPPSGCWC